MKEIRGRLSEASGAAWDRLLNEEGVDASAVLEAMGLQMAAGKWFPSTRVIELARAIGRERKRR